MARANGPPAKEATLEEGRQGLTEPLLGDEAVDKDGKGAAKAGGKTSVSFGRLIGLAKPETGLLALGTVALLLSTLSSMAIPAFIGQLIDDVVGSDEKKKLDRSCLLLLVIFLAGSLFTIIRAFLFNLSGERLVLRLRTKLFQAVTSQEIGFFDDSKTGELMNRLSSDTTVVQNAVTVNISMGLRSVASVLLSVLLLFVTSWKLSLVMLAVVPLLVVISRAYGTYARGLAKSYQAALAESADVAQEALSNCRTVRAFGAEAKELLRYTAKVQMSYSLGVKKALANGLFMGGIGLLAYLAMLTVLWYGGRLVLDGELSAGSLTSFLLYTVYIATGLGTLSGLFSEFMSALGASERVFELIDREPKIPVCGGEWPSESLASGHIRFQDVSFSYPTRPEVPVLKNFTLDIEADQTVALVGQSGSGKSTVLSLVERFYDPAQGCVYVNGRDLRDLDPAWLHSNIAMVSQEPVLFGGSIRDNITYGCFDRNTGAPARIDLRKVEEAAKLANCHDFIVQFPEGYETLVGERGVRLSGGQKQRIAIARALLMNPRILILDEATSALDAESEHLVQQAIDRLMQKRTVVCIAHRLSTIKNAHKIVVVQQGCISDQGTHTELLERSEVYMQLVQRQLQWGGPPKQEDPHTNGHNLKQPFVSAFNGHGAAQPIAHPSSGVGVADESMPPSA